MVYTHRDDDIPAPLTSLQFQIMTALSAGPMHGYLLAQRCSTESGEYIQPSSGTLYNVLDRLLKQGHIMRVERTRGRGSANPRQVYALTGAGRLVLGWEADRLTKVANLAKRRLKV